MVRSRLSITMVLFLLVATTVAACSSGAGQSDLSTDLSVDADQPDQPDQLTQTIAPTVPKPTVEDERPLTATEVPQIRLADLGPAPEVKNDVWLNSEPLRLAELRGKVVLLEFWTFGCINCQRVIPFMREWHEQYAGDDFVVLTVHYPEFGYEENVDNVREALVKNGIEFAVAIDNDGLTWRAYNQRFWPTRYLIDKDGHIRYKHIGEGAYEETDAAIRQLIAEEPAS